MQIALTIQEADAFFAIRFFRMTKAPARQPENHLRHNVFFSLWRRPLKEPPDAPRLWQMTPVALNRATSIS
jgi:hypothetical protein